MTIDGDSVVEEVQMFERGMHVYLFYCLCYVKEISTDMLEEQVSEERYPDLNEEEDIRMKDSGEEHCRGVAEDGKDTSKIHSLRWDVYTREKEDLIKREFLESVPHPKGESLQLQMGFSFPFLRAKDLRISLLIMRTRSFFTLLYTGGTYARLVYIWHKHILRMIAVMIVFHAANRG